MFLSFDDATLGRININATLAKGSTSGGTGPKAGLSAVATVSCAGDLSGLSIYNDPCILSHFYSFLFFHSDSVAESSSVVSVVGGPATRAAASARTFSEHEA